MSAPAMKPPRLAERITSALRQVVLDTLEHIAELEQHVLRQRVGARALFVDHQPGDAVLVARDFQCFQGALALRRDGGRPRAELA